MSRLAPVLMLISHLTLPIAAAWGQSPAPELVADLRGELPDDPRTVGSFRVAFPVDLGGRTYFMFKDDLHGRELWMTDGTATGTSILADICPGPCSSDPSSLLVAGERLFFQADDGISGSELWTSDGTPAGTSMVADLVVGDAGWSRIEILPLGSRVIFLGRRFNARRPAIWSSDGTADGTVRLSYINSHSSSRLMAGLGERVFFAHGNALWATDGTTSGTRAIERFEVSLLDFAAAAGKIFFTHSDTLVVSDGTAAGTRELFGVPGGGPFATIGDTAFFWSGCALWQTDGTVGGSREILTLSSSGNHCPSYLEAHRGLLYFDFIAARYREIWVSDGTPGDTRSLGPLWNFGLEGSRIFVPFGDALFFNTQDELRRTDGTVEGTVRVLPGHFDLSAGQGALFLRSTSDPLTTDLLLSNGTATSTAAFAHLPRFSASSHPTVLEDFDGRVLFTATDDSGEKVFTVGESPGSTTSIFFEDADGVLWSHSFPEAAVWNGILALNVDGLLLSDISSGSIEPVGPPLMRAAALTPLGNHLYFAGWTRNESEEPWVSDGTAAGTRFIQDILPGGDVVFIAPPIDGASRPREFTPLLGRTFFTADGVLYSSAGEPGDAEPLIEEGAENFPIDPSDLELYGERLFFAADWPETGRELWRTDGTPEGTLCLVDVLPGPASSSPENLTPFRGTLYFLTGREEGRGQLWKTNGWPGGTHLIFDLAAAAGWARLEDLTVAGDRLFFTATTPALGRELWTSDGTTPGTRLVRDLFAGPASSNPRELTAHDGTVLFAALDAAHGVELWQSDGTATGTRRWSDLNPGPASSDPSSLRLVGSQLFFAASTAATGRELYRLRLPSFADGFESGDLSRWSASVPR